MEIYLDIVLIENFVIDMFILLITAKLMHIKHNNKSLILASSLGALYTVVSVFPELKIFSLFPFQILVGWIMIRILLERNNFKVELKATGIYILIAFLLSGISFGFSTWENKYSFEHSYVISNASMQYLLISIILVYIISDRVLSYLRERALITNFIYEVELYIRGVRYVVRGFLDTGNELKESITNLPCIIVEEKYINYFQETDSNTYYIQYNGIGYRGKMKGFKVDKVILKKSDNEEMEISAIICPCKEVLNKENEFNALLSRGVI